MERSLCLSKNSIITELWNNSRVNYLIRIKAPKGMTDDFKQDVFLHLSELDEVKLFELNGRNELIWYVCRVILNMASNTGQFKYKYRDVDYALYGSELERDELTGCDESLVREVTAMYFNSKIADGIQGINDAHIFSEYVELRSCEAVALRMGVPKYHVVETVKRVKNELGTIIRNGH